VCVLVCVSVCVGVVGDVDSIGIVCICLFVCMNV